MISVVDFSSILQIVFGMNFLFLVLELKPLLDRQWEKVANEHRETVRSLYRQFALWAIGDDEAKEKLRSVAPQVIALISPRIGYKVLTWIVSVLTLVASVISVGFLIWCGFDPKAHLPAWVMATYLFMALSLVPVHVIVTTWARRSHETYLRRIAADFTSIERKPLHGPVDFFASMMDGARLGDEFIKAAGGPIEKAESLELMASLDHPDVQELVGMATCSQGGVKAE